MKNSTKKIVLNQDGTVNKLVKNSISNCRIDGNKIYTDMWTGSGRRKNLRSSFQTIESILIAQGYKFVQGNDAVRGGQEGNFIKVSSVALNFIKGLIQ